MKFIIIVSLLVVGVFVSAESWQNVATDIKPTSVKQLLNQEADEYQLFSPDEGTGQDYAEFGVSTAIEGNVAVVGAKGYRIGQLNRGIVYVFEHDGQEWVEKHTLLASDGAQGDYFGYSVSISGNTILVGAYGDDDIESRSGSAYVFTYDGSQWTETAKLQSPIAYENAYFGWKVDINQDRAIIGAPLDVIDNITQGSVYVFDFDGASWNLSGKLSAPDGAFLDRFGERIDQSDDVVIVGSPNSDQSGTELGTAYIYTFDGASWELSQQLYGPSVGTDIHFGQSVAIDGGIMMVTIASYTPRAYVYNQNGTTWVQNDLLYPYNQKLPNITGSSVLLSQNRAIVSGKLFEEANNVWTRNDSTGVIGAQDFDGIHAISGNKFFDIYGNKSGMAAISEYSNSQQWARQDFVAKDWSYRDLFGSQVSILGDKAMISAISDDEGMVRDSGAVFYYQNEGGWVLKQKIKRAQLKRDDYFGSTIHMADDWTFVSTSDSILCFQFNGSLWEELQTIPSPYPGSSIFGDSIDVSGDRMLVSGDKYEVLLYEYNGVEWELTQFLTGNDTSGDKDFGSSVSIHNEQLVVGARHDNELGNGSGSVYVFGFDGLNWTQTAKLTSSNGHVKQNFGTSVDLNGDRLLVGAPSSSQTLKTGSVYYFQYQGGSWNELSQIKPSDDVTGVANYFGWEIEVKDNLAIMGALEAVYIYDFIADEWVERKKISGSEGSLFGREFSLSGDIAMFSDPWDDTVAIESGTVYVYDGVSDLIFADTFE